MAFNNSNHRRTRTNVFLSGRHHRYLGSGTHKCPTCGTELELASYHAVTRPCDDQYIEIYERVERRFSRTERDLYRFVSPFYRNLPNRTYLNWKECYCSFCDRIVPVDELRAYEGYEPDKAPNDRFYINPKILFSVSVVVILAVFFGLVLLLEHLL